MPHRLGDKEVSDSGPAHQDAPRPKDPGAPLQIAGPGSWGCPARCGIAKRYPPGQQRPQPRPSQPMQPETAATGAVQRPRQIQRPLSGADRLLNGIPHPHTVLIKRGCRLFSCNFSRRRAIWLMTVLLLSRYFRPRPLQTAPRWRSPGPVFAQIPQQGKLPGVRLISCPNKGTPVAAFADLQPRMSYCSGCSGRGPVLYCQ